jgi:ATP-dependent DNA ligase
MWAANLSLVPALMHPTLLPRPFHRDGWVYEEKVDGYRMVVYKDDDGVRLVSRNVCDHSPLPARFAIRKTLAADRTGRVHPLSGSAVLNTCQSVAHTA